MDVESLLSVVIPVYNGRKYLAEAVESVRRQSWPDLEILIVDDGSTDGTADLAQSLGGPIRVLRQQQAGAATARNRGVEEARGAWLAFLDADDRWTDSKIARQMAVFKRDAGVDIVFGHVRQFVCPTLTEAEKKAVRCPDQAVPGQHPGTMLLPREVFQTIGPYDAAYDVGEIVDWYARALETGARTVMLEDVLMERRLHNANQGILKRDAEKEAYLRALRAALQRRRAATEISSDRDAGPDAG